MKQLLLERNMGLDSVQASVQASVHAASVAEVRRILGGSREEVGLALVDIDLPGGDGIELIEELREAHTDFPVLALATGRSSQWRRTPSIAGRGGGGAHVGEPPIEELTGAVRRLAAGGLTRG